LVRKELIAARLGRLHEYVRILKAIQRYSLESFKNDVFIHATAERYLQLAIECVLDIGNYVISDRGFRKPDTYAEIFDILLENKIIPKKLFKELEGMSAFRNVLVHDYLQIDLDKVYDILHKRLPSLEKLGAAFSRLL